MSILEAIFNEGVYTWVLKIVTDGQTDSLTNLIKCVVVYRLRFLSSWAPGFILYSDIDLHYYMNLTTVVLVISH